MKKVAEDIELAILVKDYLELNSSYKVAEKYNISATAVKRLLKKAGVLRTQNEAATTRNLSNDCFGTYVRTEEQKQLMSDLGKLKSGDKNPFFGKKHNKKTKNKLSEYAKKRTKERNPNYKDGKNIRRPRDFKSHEFTPLRNYAFNRDKHTCNYCKKMGGHLHAHHIIPYWVKADAFLDVDNLITVCKDCHFIKAHKGNWILFDSNLVTNILLDRYSLDRERLNELALKK